MKGLSGKRVVQILIALLLVLAVVKQPTQAATTAVLIWNNVALFAQTAGAAVLTFLAAVGK